MYSDLSNIIFYDVQCNAITETVLKFNGIRGLHYTTLLYVNSNPTFYSLFAITFKKVNSYCHHDCH